MGRDNDPSQESRVIQHTETGLPVPRTKVSLSLKLAQKISKNKKSKESLNGLYESLAPGSSVIKTDSHTSINNEPGKRKVTIRKHWNSKTRDENWKANGPQRIRRLKSQSTHG